MKKVLALALALVMALSMGTMAFAADAPSKCGICGSTFTNEEDFAAHVAECKPSEEEAVMSIINMLIDILKASFSQWDAVESVVIRLVDFIENIGTAAVSEADVKGAVADLEAALAGAEIPGVNDLLNQLKQMIKDLYAGEVATTVEATTEAAPAADTGSSSVGIAVFAAVSVAAAAAYVCTKKSK